MSVLSSVRLKLRAWQVGRPLPRYATRHHAVVDPDQALIVAFVRMAGESRPWGIAWGVAGHEPTIQSVPDGRVRDDVSALCADFAEDLLAHMRVHNWTYNPISEDAKAEELRQVWLPNGQHIAMLHQLNYTYSQTKYGGGNNETLRALGRLAGWMFRDTSRTGHQHVVSASALLGHWFAFPAQDARTAHLGYQLAWLTTKGDREERVKAATDAEQLTISPTMDPAVDRELLAPLVERWQDVRQAGDEDKEAASEIAAILKPELKRRWQLTEKTYNLAREDERPINTGIATIVESAHGEFWYQHQRIELRESNPAQGRAFVPSPETDFHGSAAASRYLEYAAADEHYVSALIHDDEALLKEAVAAGRAFVGTVLRVYDLGNGRSSNPHWEIAIDASAPNRLRENGWVVPHGSPGHTAVVQGWERDGGNLIVTLRWTTRKTMPLARPLKVRPNDDEWEGGQVAFVPSTAEDLTRRRGRRVWSAADGPGAWLTHGRASDPIEISGDDGSPDLVIDDVAQLEEGQQVEI